MVMFVNAFALWGQLLPIKTPDVVDGANWCQPVAASVGLIQIDPARGLCQAIALQGAACVRRAQSCKMRLTYEQIS